MRSDRTKTYLCAQTAADEGIKAVMDAWTKCLLGATAFAVLGYFTLIYGGCAMDDRCHLRSCYAHRTCGVVYDTDTETKAQ
ncbi:hypothetical protein UP09_35945 [Bradyrhizobium sp. LTSP885]|nr:hypothetical protein UP09_35945 [Bradyrhizobium sp. LTSP885]